MSAKSCSYFFSVLSANSVLKARMTRINDLSRQSLPCLLPQQSEHLAPQLPHTLQSRSRHPQNFVKQPSHDRQELQHALQPLPRVRIALRVRLRLRHTLRQAPAKSDRSHAASAPRKQSGKSPRHL